MTALGELACGRAKHYFYDEAVARVEREWTENRIWYRVTFCSCGGWRLFRIS